ncbi:hypothetical protein [Pseudomonas aeruginosa]|jgi:hypothetical protein|uniref:hypothetical protein n=1 Tax=Pseudomonas aeruginosa TaxID=287 RepID=UPI0004D9D47E|nr:hypothetical protein [Pseudomonas aeruginosa]KEA10936.1 hypothetical protein BH77_30360 [Pseudomonas aeruginosa C2773C]ATH01729.1 hypothetical protein AXX03_05650 [Pseudomonas aeruginosa]MBX5551486.1 hypothetical protein [Pseudomonas aeruginosa]MCG9956944.1 hypothetical protein [Pseudomonas aeruginosa]MCO2075066.1 hypothetical protein [Pseudomonas aeruginosa]
MSTNHQCNAVIDAIGEIIGKNADWLDGRLFQKLAMIAARANYEDEELDDYGTFDDFLKAFETSSTAIQAQTADDSSDQSHKPKELPPLDLIGLVRSLPQSHWDRIAQQPMNPVLAQRLSALRNEMGDVRVLRNEPDRLLILVENGKPEPFLMALLAKNLETKQ